MDVNADFKKRAVVHGAQVEWIASPMPGVDRRMLDRLGDEVARATSIVRYAPGSHFSPHTHTGGEEFLVLAGVFQDEHGDYPVGTYVRNPPTTCHTPGAQDGCTIFVKLWQFDMADRAQFRVDTNGSGYADQGGGVSRMALHKDAYEDVCVERWEAGTPITLPADGGTEVLVLDGGFAEGSERFGPQSWLRLPVDGAAQVTAGPQGAKVWVKRGHLRKAPKAPQG